RTRVVRPSPLASSYTLETILDECSQPPAVFTGGRMTFAEPMSGAVEVEFPAPVGRQRPMYTIHSEVLQLSRTYKSKGVEEVSFRIAFGEEFTANLAFLRALGLLSSEPLDVRGTKVSPRAVLLALQARLPPPVTEGPLDQHEVLRAVVVGGSGGSMQTHVVDCHCTGVPAWNLGLDVDTGSPPSIAVQMLQRREITLRGAVNPEQAIPVVPFFKELEKRGMWIERSVVGSRKAKKRATA
ncbi:MAG: saccharopine dehydrogenase family protein, partial [Myxococcales bacterium]